MEAMKIAEQKPWRERLRSGSAEEAIEQWSALARSMPRKGDPAFQEDKNWGVWERELADACGEVLWKWALSEPDQAERFAAELSGIELKSSAEACIGGLAFLGACAGRKSALPFDVALTMELEGDDEGGTYESLSARRVDASGEWTFPNATVKKMATVAFREAMDQVDWDDWGDDGYVSGMELASELGRDFQMTSNMVGDCRWSALGEAVAASRLAKQLDESVKKPRAAKRAPSI